MSEFKCRPIKKIHLKIKNLWKHLKKRKTNIITLRKGDASYINKIGKYITISKKKSKKQYNYNN